MVGKRSPFIDQIKSYICLLSIQDKDIFNEICRAYRNNELLFSSATRWCKTSGVDSVRDESHACRSKTATSRRNFEKVKDLISNDERFTIRYIAKCIHLRV
jgi:hypothetical protein